MTTFKAEVYAHQRKSDGTYNIKIRVTHNKKKRYLATVWYVTKDDLTRSLKIKNQKYIDMTDDLIRSYRLKCDQKGEALKAMTIDQVVDWITTDRQEIFDLDIVAYARAVIDELTASGHEGNAKAYKVAIESLVKFMGRERVSIKEVTVKMLKDWADWISKQPNVSVGYSSRNYLSRLRAIHNRAKKEYNDEDAGVIRIPNSPFSHIEMPKQPQPRKRALTIDQIQRMAALEYREILQPGNNRFNFARDLFLLSFCLVGMNGIDLYNCTHIEDGRITYNRTKTKNRRADKAEISIRIEPEVQALVDKYRDPSGERVFVFYKLYSSMDTFSAAINKGLKKIGKILEIDDLEFYAARHSWATIALNDALVDKYTVHSALNHVDDTMRVTDIYIKKSWAHIDAANRAVLDLMKLNFNV